MSGNVQLHDLSNDLLKEAVAEIEASITEIRKDGGFRSFKLAIDDRIFSIQSGVNSTTIEVEDMKTTFEALTFDELVSILISIVDELSLG